jgi:hypothetical protein
MHATTPGTRDVRRFIVAASLVFAVLLLAGAWLLLRVRGEPFTGIFDADRLASRIATGVAIGTGAGLLCGQVVSRARPLERLRMMAREAIEGIEPRWHTFAIVSVAAGVSEEVFFRAALEPLTGRWLAALGFVALHGALRVKSRGSLAFAVFLFAASTGLSALCAWRGLEAAIAAHAAYDLAVLAGLKRGVSGREPPAAGLDGDN